MNDHSGLVVRPYLADDERAWLRCRLFAFFDTAYFDDVVRSKTVLAEGSIELVAVDDRQQLVGIIDVDVESSAATIDTIAVDPSARRRGVARTLLRATVAALSHDIGTLDAWTRDDEPTNRWYLAMGFREQFRYLHVYLDHDEPADGFRTPPPLSRPMKAFMHAPIEHESDLRARFGRVHVCRQYVVDLDTARGAADVQPDAPSRIG